MNQTDEMLVSCIRGLLPKLSEEQKLRLLAYAEGMAFMADKLAAQSNEKP